MLKRLGIELSRQSVGLLALVVAVSGGTAYAATSMWTGANIVDGSLTGADVGNGTLTGTDITNGSLTGADIADGSLTSADIASTGGGGGTAPLVATDIGPLSVPADSIATFRTQFASVDFTTASPGFVDVRVASSFAIPATGCTVGPVGVTINLGLDDIDLAVGTGGGQSETIGRAMRASAWLPAGTHTLRLLGSADCTDIGPITSAPIEFSTIQVLVTAP